MKKNRIELRKWGWKKKEKKRRSGDNRRHGREEKKRKCFIYRGFGYIAYYCRSKREIKENRRVEVRESECWPLSNKFKVLISRVMQAEISSKKPEKKEKLLRKVIVKIGLKQKDNKDRITVEMLLSSSVIELVMSLEFTRKNKLDRLYKKYE